MLSSGHPRLVMVSEGPDDDPPSPEPPRPASATRITVVRKDARPWPKAFIDVLGG
jgi:hypothetical protein